MSVETTAEALLAEYLHRYLWADEDWLEVDGASATYWQARLAQTTTVELSPRAGRSGGSGPGSSNRSTMAPTPVKSV